MRKIIAAFNMTLDGHCDHTAGIADADLHQHYTDLLNSAGTILYGRTTYKLMEDHWPNLVKNPSGEKAMDDFALSIERIEKVLFSRTIKSVDWHNARVATQALAEEVAAMKQQDGKDILVGSRSLIIQLLNLGMVDEFQLCVQPLIGESGITLFDKIDHRIQLQLLRTKPFAASGSIVLYYAPKVTT